MLLSFLEKGGVLCITILPQGLPTISNRIFPNTSLPTLSPPLLSLLCSSIVAKGQEFKVKVKVKCFFFSFSIMSQISAARAAKMALQNINPNVATGHFNRKASPTPVLLDPNLAHANVNADDDDASLDDNSVAEPDTERMIFGAEVACLIIMHWWRSLVRRYKVQPPIFGSTTHAGRLVRTCYPRSRLAKNSMTTKNN